MNTASEWQGRKADITPRESSSIQEEEKRRASRSPLMEEIGRLVSNHRRERGRSVGDDVE